MSIFIDVLVGVLEQTPNVLSVLYVISYLVVSVIVLESYLSWELPTDYPALRAGAIALLYIVWFTITQAQHYGDNNMIKTLDQPGRYTSDTKIQVNPIDSDETGNQISNLEWCTSKEDEQHSY